ncbi:MAG: AraC family transcriptional regulator [Janthinobacterium lividum]
MNGFLPAHLEIRTLLEKFLPQSGSVATPIDGLRLYRSDAPSEPLALEYKPGLAYVAQGAKTVMLGADRFHYGEGEYLLTSIGLPVMAQITAATRTQPHLCFLLDIDLLQLTETMNQIGNDAIAASDCECSLSVNQPSPQLLDGCLRLLRLLDTPAAIPILAPLIRKEIAYHLLTGPDSARLRHMAASESQTHRIGRAIGWIKEHFASPLRIDQLAAHVNMSASSLHHQFKTVTAMTPMQYQKLWRLQSARQLMLIDMVDAAAAGYRVGYESPSQFSREYARHFGQAPMRDIAQTRAQLLGEGATGVPHPAA